MGYTNKELLEIYNGSNKFKELESIGDTLNNLCKIMEFDPYTLDDLIETLLYFKDLNILDKVNNETLSLLKQLTFGNKKEIFKDDNTIFLNKYLRYLLLPFNYNHCDKEYNLGNFLGEFDVFINLIKDNCNKEDYINLYKYNKDLYEIVGRFYKIRNELEEMNLFIYSGLKEKVLLNSVISHLSTLLYLSIDNFDYNYDLLNETFNDILNNIFEFLMICDENKIFQNMISPYEDEIIREYNFCLELLKNKYKEIVEVKRRKL